MRLLQCGLRLGWDFCGSRLRLGGSFDRSGVLRLCLRRGIILRVIGGGLKLDEGVVLIQEDAPGLGQLQHCQKRGDALGAVLHSVVEVGHLKGAGEVEPLQDIGYLGFHRDYLFRHYGREHIRPQGGVFLYLRGYGAVGVIELLLIVQAGVELVYRQLYRLSDEHQPSGIALPELSGCQLAEGVFYHTPLELLFELLGLLRLGEQVAGLYVNEPCSHLKEIGCLLVVLYLGVVDIFKVLLKQQAYLDIVDIELMLGN